MSGQVRYFLREEDILAPVYKVDFEANTYSLVASRIGVVPVGGDMGDRGAKFLTAPFTEVWPMPGGEDGVRTFTRDQPVELPQPNPPQPEGRAGG